MKFKYGIRRRALEYEKDQVKIMKNTSKITIKDTEVLLLSHNHNDFISLTDIAKYRDKDHPANIISLWLRTFSTIEYLGLWEILNNPEFNPHIYEEFKSESARPSFWMSPQKWIKETQAVGMISKAGRHGGGTFAHVDIAFKFAAWISAEFELYLVSEFKRLKVEESKRLSAEWSLQRTLAKINYCIQTDAIKDHIIPNIVNDRQKKFAYANEADILNVALFGETAAEWRTKHAESKGNIRDEATLEQLVVLSNLESINALLIGDGIAQGERLVRLNAVAIVQLRSLMNHSEVRAIESRVKTKKEER